MPQQLECHNKRSKTLPSGSSRGMANRTIAGLRLGRVRRNTEGAMVEREVFMDDLVLAVMGPTGAGKSNFIMKLIGGASEQQELQISSTSLKSHTSDIQLIRILNNATYGDRIVIVDTPGFDDTYKSDMEILTIIGRWLEKTYRGQVRLSGIFYLHRISDNRMAGSPRKNLAMFKRLTGDAAAGRVVFVTTMWDLARDEARRETFRKRTEQLMNLYWEDTLKAGAQEAPFDNTHEAAMRCIDLVLPTYSSPASIRSATPLNIQEELVEGGRRINETAAGRELYSSLQTTLNQTRRTLQELHEQARDAGDHETAKRLEKDIAMTESQLQRTFQDVNELRIPWWRKAYLIVPSWARTWVSNVLYQPEKAVEVEVNSPVSPLLVSGADSGRRRTVTSVFGDSWRFRPAPRAQDRVTAPSLAPQISEGIFGPQSSFRDMFHGTACSLPPTPISTTSVVDALKALVLGSPRNDSKATVPIPDIPLPEDLSSHAAVTSESPKSMCPPLPPDPGPSEPHRRKIKRVTIFG